jgi:hypothetical protein
MIGHQRRRFIPEEQEAGSNKRVYSSASYSGNKEGLAVSLCMSAEMAAAANSETVGGSMMKTGNVDMCCLASQCWLRSEPSSQPRFSTSNIPVPMSLPPAGRRDGQ